MTKRSKKLKRVKKSKKSLFFMISFVVVVIGALLIVGCTKPGTGSITLAMSDGLITGAQINAADNFVGSLNTLSTCTSEKECNQSIDSAAQSLQTFSGAKADSQLHIQAVTSSSTTLSSFHTNSGATTASARFFKNGFPLFMSAQAQSVSDSSSLGAGSGTTGYESLHRDIIFSDKYRSFLLLFLSYVDELSSVAQDSGNIDKSQFFLTIPNMTQEVLKLLASIPEKYSSDTGKTNDGILLKLTGVVSQYLDKKYHIEASTISDLNQTIAKMSKRNMFQDRNDLQSLSTKLSGVFVDAKTLITTAFDRCAMGDGSCDQEKFTLYLKSVSSLPYSELLNAAPLVTEIKKQRGISSPVEAWFKDFSVDVYKTSLLQQSLIALKVFSSYMNGLGLNDQSGNTNTVNSDAITGMINRLEDFFKGNSKEDVGTLLVDASTVLEGGKYYTQQAASELNNQLQESIAETTSLNKLLEDQKKITADVLADRDQKESALVSLQSEQQNALKNISNLQQQVSSLTGSLESSQKSLSDQAQVFNTQLIDIQNKLSDKQAELQQKQADFVALQNTNAGLQQDLNQNQNKLIELQSSLDASTKNQDSLTAQINDLNAKIQQQQQQLAQNQNDLSSSQKKLEDSIASQNDLAQQFNAIKAQLVQSQSDLATANITISEKQQALTFTQNQLAQANQALEEKQAEIVQNQSDLAAKQDALNQMTNSRDQLKTSLDQVTAQLNQTQGSLTALKADYDNKLIELSAANQSVIQKQAEIDQYAANLATKQSLYDQMVTQNQILQGQVSNLSLELSQTQSDLSNANQDKSVLAQQVENLNANTAQLEQTLASMTKEKESLQQQINSLVSQDQAGALTSMNAKVDVLNKQIAELTANLNTANQSKVDLQNQLKVVSGDLAQSQSNLSTANKNIATLTQNYADLKNDYNSKISDLNSANSYLTKTTLSLNSANANVANLQQLVDAKETARVKALADLTVAQNALNSLNIADANLKQQLDNANAKLSTANSDLATATSNLSAANQSKSTLQQTVSDQLAQIAKLNATIAQNATAYSTLNQNYTALQLQYNDTLEKLTKTNSDLTLAQNSLLTANNNYTTTLAALNAANASLVTANSQVTSLKNQVVTLTASLQTATNNANTLQTSLNSANSQISSLNASYAAAQQQNAQFSDAIALYSLLTKSVKINVSSTTNCSGAEITIAPVGVTPYTTSTDISPIKIPYGYIYEKGKQDFSGFQSGSQSTSVSTSTGINVDSTNDNYTYAKKSKLNKTGTTTIITNNTLTTSWADSMYKTQELVSPGRARSVTFNKTTGTYDQMYYDQFCGDAAFSNDNDAVQTYRVYGIGGYLGSSKLTSNFISPYQTGGMCSVNDYDVSYDPAIVRDLRISYDEVMATYANNGNLSSANPITKNYTCTYFAGARKYKIVNPSFSGIINQTLGLDKLMIDPGNGGTKYIEFSLPTVYFAPSLTSASIEKSIRGTTRCGKNSLLKPNSAELGSYVNVLESKVVSGVTLTPAMTYNTKITAGVVDSANPDLLVDSNFTLSAFRKDLNVSSYSYNAAYPTYRTSGQILNVLPTLDSQVDADIKARYKSDTSVINLDEFCTF